jgi:hypothetical protein
MTNRATFSEFGSLLGYPSGGRLQPENRIPETWNH